MSSTLATPVQTPASRNWRRFTGIVLAYVAALVAIASIGLYAFTIFTPAQAAGTLQKITDVSLKDSGTASFDQQALDPNSGRLFIAHPGSNDVFVLDTKTNTIVGHITGIPKNHGIVVIPALNRLYISETFDNQVYAVNETTFQIEAKIPVGQAPDIMAYDPTDHALFVSNEFGKSDSVIDVNTNQVIATIQLSGEAGNTRYDATLHRIFIAIQTLNEVVAIDPVSHAAIAGLKLPTNCTHNHGLILDEAQNLGFAVCDVSSTAVMFNLQTMQIVSSVQSVGIDPDLLAFDASRNLLYVSSHSGVLTVFSDKNASFQKVYNQCIASNAHTIFVNPTNHELYMPLVSQPSASCPAPTPKPTTPTAKKTIPTGPAELRIFSFQY